MKRKAYECPTVAITLTDTAHPLLAGSNGMPDKTADGGLKWDSPNDTFDENDEVASRRRGYWDDEE